jgi:GTPase SAR1 family protein
MSITNGNTPTANCSSQPINGFTTPSTPTSNGSSSSIDPTGAHARILNALDQLRDLGIDRGDGSAHSLPQIIVCGSQSSGKSSVLEAITGIPFPRKNEACTKYKTRVTLLRRREVVVSVGIIPDPVRSGTERDELSKFEKILNETDWHNSMRAVIDQADKIIFPRDDVDKRWTNDTLTITISGPQESDLQLLDLPGLIEADKYNAGNVEIIEKMVKDEMVKSQSIVLAVANATEDLEKHRILTIWKKLEVDGHRTLGVLTMPDISEGRATSWVQIVRGQDEYAKNTFPMDWHVLMNRSQIDLSNNSSTTDRDTKESSFFKNESPWKQLGTEVTGVKSLRQRLSILLFTVAKKELPNLHGSLTRKQMGLEMEMTKLGGDLGEGQLKKAFKESLKRLTLMSRDHRRGIRESDIRNYNGTHALRLRSRVIDQSETFRDRIMKAGHRWELEGRIPAVDPHADLDSIFKSKVAQEEAVKIEKKGKEQWIKEVTNFLNESRKGGLPGFDDHDALYELFWRLTDTWKPIAKQHIDKIFQCCTEYFEAATINAFSKPTYATAGFGNNDAIAKRYCDKYLTPALKTRRQRALEELNDLEADRLDTPQNFNKNFLIELREKRAERSLKRFLDGYDSTSALKGKSEIRVRLKGLHFS